MRNRRLKIDGEKWPEIQHFANEVARVRKKKKLSQKELGEKTGLDQAYISSLEGCFINPTLQVQASIARVLGVSLRYLQFTSPVEIDDEVELAEIPLRVADAQDTTKPD